jgi:lysophospholipase L1-like esterase
MRPSSNSIDAGSPATSNSKAKLWAGLVGVVLVATLLLLLLAEGAVRARQWLKYGTATGHEDLYLVDPTLNLRVLRPNARTGTISINGLGFRGPEIPRDKPARRIRVAFIGASTTYCAEVSGDTAVWPHLVIDSLRQRFPGAEFDYVNGAAPGYVLAASLVNLKHRIAPLKPDVVVVYHAANDLSVELRQLAERAGLYRRGDQEPGWLERNSLLYDLVRKNLMVKFAQERAKGSESVLQFEPAKLGANFAADLGELVGEAKRVAPVVAVATFSIHLRPNQSIEAKQRAAVSALVFTPFMSLDGLIAGYARFNEVIREVGRASGVNIIDGENDIPGDPEHFVDSVHFSDAGARRMAERVARALAGAPELERLVRERAAN